MKRLRGFCEVWPLHRRELHQRFWGPKVPKGQGSLKIRPKRSISIQHVCSGQCHLFDRRRGWLEKYDKERVTMKDPMVPARPYHSWRQYLQNEYILQEQRGHRKIVRRRRLQDFRCAHPPKCRRHAIDMMAHQSNQSHSQITTRERERPCSPTTSIPTTCIPALCTKKGTVVYCERGPRSKENALFSAEKLTLGNVLHTCFTEKACSFSLALDLLVARELITDRLLATTSRTDCPSL